MLAPLIKRTLNELADFILLRRCGTMLDALCTHHGNLRDCLGFIAKSFVQQVRWVIADPATLSTHHWN